MRKASYFIALILALLLCAGCSAAPAVSAPPSVEPAVSAAPSPSVAADSPKPTTEVFEISLTIPAPSLKENMLGQPAENEIYVILPPSYYQTPEKRYPTLYFLHGYGDDYIANAQRVGAGIMKKAGEFIIVGIHGTNSLGGSFYANSPVTGHWEDMVAKDVVGYVDANYRTLAKSGSRGIFGFSMGGFGALNIALKHPDVFQAVCAVGPGLWDKNGMKDALEDWDYTFETSYGAVFAPDPKGESPYAQVPKMDGSKKDKAVIAGWEQGFGDLEGKVKAYMALPEKLAGIYIAYGKADDYNWIPNGCRYLSEVLTKNNIQHQLVPFNGGHMVDTLLLYNDMLPFYAKTLKFE